MELSWYFYSLGAVLAAAWWYTQVETQRPWAVWTYETAMLLWERAWTAMMRHLGPVSPYTYQPRHGSR